MVGQILLLAFTVVTSFQFSHPSVTFFTQFVTGFFYSSGGNIPNIYNFKSIDRPTFLCALISNSCRIISVTWLPFLLRNAEMDYELCENVLPYTYTTLCNVLWTEVFANPFFNLKAGNHASFVCVCKANLQTACQCQICSGKGLLYCLSCRDSDWYKHQLPLMTLPHLQWC